MRNVVSLGSKFANKKTGGLQASRADESSTCGACSDSTGRFYIDLGNDQAPCQMLGRRMSQVSADDFGLRLSSMRPFHSQTLHILVKTEPTRLAT